jgi:hypothetical protein
MAARLEIYDSPMCCPTGVCGPSADPDLVRFATDLKWIEDHEVTVERHSLTQEPAAFAGNPIVLAACREADGASCLPIVLVDGERAKTPAGYPPRARLLDLLGLTDE